MGRLDGKVAIITGAASGIGRGTALRFAAEGAAVVIADLNDSGGEAVVQECSAAGGRAIYVHTDVAEEAQIAALVAGAVSAFGRLDIIFNNAGIAGAVGPLEQISVEDWDRSHAVLVRSVFLGIKHAVPQLRKVGGGAIISTASVAGLRGFAGLHAYCSAKAGVVNLTRSAALEYARDRIRVNCICPGGINTPILGIAAAGDAAGSNEAVEQQMAHMQPVPRAGQPADIAGMALYLASADGEWVTGQAMVVDGGLTVGSGYAPDQGSVGLLGSGFSGPSFQR